MESATPEVLRYAAFTEDMSSGPVGGSPVGVVLGAGCLQDAEIRAISEAIGCSGTAFVLPAHDDAVGTRARRHRVRCCGPSAELPSCDDAMVATAVALAEREGVGSLVLDTSAGPVSVRTVLDAGRFVATFTSPRGIRVVGSATRLALSPYDDLDDV